MRKNLLKLSSLLLLLLVFFSAFSAPVSALGEERAGRIADNPNFEREYLSLGAVRSKSVGSYAAVSLYINGRAQSFYGRVINGEVYLPVRKVAQSVAGVSASYNSKTRTLTVPSYSISVSDGAYVLYASGRPLFAMTPSVILSDGAMYTPASVLTKAFGIKYAYTGTRAVNLTGKAAPITPAERFYREDEVYWLSRIINAESRGEALLGQIGVGNVVMNRVRSSEYPNTIWGVIFDRKYGVQFSPVLDGSIYAEPTYTAYLAAKICLEGFMISDKTLFFLYPQASTSSWIPQYRKYEFTIGKHDFYS